MNRLGWRISKLHRTYLYYNVTKYTAGWNKLFISSSSWRFSWLLILKSSRLLLNYQVDNEPIGLRRWYQQGIFEINGRWLTLMIKPLQVTNKESEIRMFYMENLLSLQKFKCKFNFSYSLEFSSLWYHGRILSSLRGNTSTTGTSAKRYHREEPKACTSEIYLQLWLKN